MKHSFWGYFVVLCGIVIVVILLLVQRMTSTSEEDFYLAREVLESSMIDAVDYGTYRTTGRLVMSEQKFVEVFIRRFAESVTNNKTYELDFYDIYEEPPKASVRVRTSSGDTANIKDTVFDVNLDTLVSGILETIYSQADDDGNGNNGGDTTTVACPDGGHTTIHYTPNNPDGGDDDDDNNNNTGDDDDLITSSVQNFYSVGYVSNKNAYNSQTDSCNNLSTSGGMDYLMSYTSLPSGLSDAIDAGRIKSCEVIPGSARVFTSFADVTNYRKWFNEYGQYLVGYKGGGISEDFNNFSNFATPSEIDNIKISCNPVPGEGTIQIRVIYSTKTNNRSTANKNIVTKAVAQNGNTVYCAVYTGVSWKLKFKYSRN